MGIPTKFNTDITSYKCYMHGMYQLTYLVHVYCWDTGMELPHDVNVHYMCYLSYELHTIRLMTKM